MKLSEFESRFQELGINVVGMTYDPNDVSRKFSEQNDITYPILRDVNAHYVRAFGILNEAYEPGHRAYGIPHPGMFLIDGAGVIRAKFAEEDYRQRPEFEMVLEAAREMVKP
ncbi:MAG: redoxin domain-containing protein [Pseudomonadales bacterium]|nr:redoxin domain-containing protein [Pseudomonadales bacterium]